LVLPYTLYVQLLLIIYPYIHIFIPVSYLNNTFFFTEIYENTKKPLEIRKNPFSLEIRKIRFLEFYEKNKLLEFTGSDWKFSKSGNNNLGEKEDKMQRHD